MDHKVLNLCLIGLFFVVNLVIGLYSGRGVSTMREYVLGKKPFGVVSVFLAILATSIGGTAVMGNLSYFFSAKIGIILMQLIRPILVLFILATFIIPKFRKRSNWLTLGDIMKTFYGKYAGIITGIFGLIHSLCFAGLEICALKTIFEVFFGITSDWLTIGCSFLFAVYAISGGISSITNTDVFKFIIFVIGIPTIAYFAIGKAGGIIEIFSDLPSDRFSDLNFSLFTDNTEVLVFSLLPFALTCPFFIQRILMASDNKNLSKMLYIYGIAVCTFCIVMMLIAFSVFKLSPSLAQNQLLKYSVDLLPIGMQGLAIVALIAIIVSSVDSMLQIAGVTLVRDIINQLLNKENIELKDDINELKWSRIATFGCSIVALIIALNAKDTLSIASKIFYFTGPITLLPLICGITGVNVDKESYFHAFVCTILAYIYTTFFLSAEYAGFKFLIHMATNAIVFFGSLMIKNGGKIVFLVDGGDDEENKKCNTSLVEIFSLIWSFPSHMASYSRKKVEKYGAPYVMFAVFCIINYVLPFFLWTSKTTPYIEEIFYIRLIGGILLCFLFVKEKWPRFLIPYLPLFWHFVLFYVLAFSNTVMFLTTKGDVECLINVAVSIFFLIVLVDWVSFVLISVLGIIFGFLVFIFLLGGELYLNLDFDTKYLLIYQMFFGTVIGLIFARRKQAYIGELVRGRDSATELYEMTSRKLIYNELAPLRISKNLGENNMNLLAKMDNIRSAIASRNFDFAAESLDILESDILNVVVNGKKCIRLNESEVELSHFIQSLEELFKNNFHYDISIILRSKSLTIKCDKMMVYRIIFQAINEMRTDLALVGLRPEDVSMTIDVSDTKLHYYTPLLSEYSKTIDAIRFTVSTVDSMDYSLLKKTYEKQLIDVFQIPLHKKNIPDSVIAENYLEAHFGLFEVFKVAKGIMKIYVLPQNVHEIRPVILDSNDLQKDLKDYWPEAMDREYKFANEISRKAPKIKWENIQKTLDFIRKVHDRQVKSAQDSTYLDSIDIARILLGMISTPLINIKHAEEFELCTIDQTNDSMTAIFCEIQIAQEAIIIATLLQDVLEYLAISPSIVESIFGSEVSLYVLNVAKLTNNKMAALVANTEGFKHALGKEAIPFCIKIANAVYRLYNIDKIVDEELRREKAKQIQNLFILPANALGFDVIAKDIINSCNHIVSTGAIEGFEFTTEVMTFLDYKWTIIRKS